MHKTGNIHGVLPSHVGMEVRFTAVQEELKKKLGLVQEQRATIVSFEFHPDDEQGYEECPPGKIFRPRFLPQGIWMQVHGFKESPIYQEVAETLLQGVDDSDDDGQAEARARGLLLFRPSEQEFTWQSSGSSHAVRRSGFTMTHAYYITSTLSQGQTLRKGVTIDCARNEIAGRAGMSDDQWWLHVYVMLSRATCMRNLLILRPPPREFLERGPPASLKEALHKFDQKAERSRQEAEQLAEAMGLVLPPA